MAVPWQFTTVIWQPHGSPKAFSWQFHGSPMVVPWQFHGCPMAVSDLFEQPGGLVVEPRNY